MAFVCLGFIPHTIDFLTQTTMTALSMHVTAPATHMIGVTIIAHASGSTTKQNVVCHDCLEGSCHARESKPS
eukprot:m.1281901 g.1281901  ORF g.1281901 m.1281901 type:complete len:72 (-) comp24773_c2_seq39:1020-1235(-)